MAFEVDSAELDAFCALAPRIEHSALLRVCDDAFREYGHVAHLQDRGSRITVSINPRVVDDSDAPVGCIGNLVLETNADRLMDAAHTWLRTRGARVVRGPIVRHTWYPFRAVTEGFDNWPALSGEPWNTPALVTCLQAFGYEERWRYLTTRTNDLTFSPKLASKLRQFRASGFRIRSLDAKQLLPDLSVIHRLINHSFAPPQNTMFAPITMQEFLLVLGISGESSGGFSIDPDWVHLCFTADDVPAGFLLMTNEGAMASIKTLCVAPEFRGSGVGGALVAQAHMVARSSGARWVAHTLMADTGPSMSITSASRHEVLRRYAVFERTL